MEILLLPIIIFVFIAPVLTIIKFFQFLTTNKRVLKSNFSIWLSVFVVFILPLLFMALIDQPKNECCGDTAFFAPGHKPSIYIFIFLSILAYFYSILIDEVSAPLTEVLVNCFLIIGIAINIVMMFHHHESASIFLGNLPIVLLFIIALAENQIKLIESIEKGNLVFKTSFTQFIAKFLLMSPIARYPILIVLCLPIIELLTTILLLFGQKPDSLILAFTQTYSYGLSQLDDVCQNADCGGHYLCSVAANGHTKVVKPIRYGIRNNGLIICNRQLLVANAFEELIQEKMPKTHRFIRRQYNKVGNLIHKYYYLFENKHLSNTIYILMKPLEWFFLFTLYLFDKKPENRIAMQYLSRKDRVELKRKLNNY